MSPKVMARAFVATLLMFAVVLTAAAQTPQVPKPTLPSGLKAPAGVDPRDFPPANETREQRMARLGTVEDPGFDPDPKKVWLRFGREYTIEKFDKKFANFDQPWGFVRPYGPVNIGLELYDQNADWVWVWMPVVKKDEQGRIITPTAPADPAPRTTAMDKLSDDDIRFLKVLKADFRELTPPDNPLTLKFKESVNGLPQAGSWRNSLDLGDFNEDGFLDIVTPPQRSGASTVPYIFLGDGKGNWKDWEQASFPVGINYGSVVAADFNGDKHLDIAAGVHLTGVKVFLGDGKGYFVDGSKGLPDNFPTRRVNARDVDDDGDVDLIAISEGPTLHNKGGEGSRVRVYLNDGKAEQWKELPVAEVGRQVGGDWLTVGDFNGDSKPDIAGASIYFSGPDIFYLSDSKKKLTWKAFGRGWLPFQSYYFALTSGKFTSKNRDDVILSYARFWPPSVDPRTFDPPVITEVGGVEHVSWSKNGPKRTPIVRWHGRKSTAAMANGDFNGDGHLDIVYSRVFPREFVILLGDGKGNFSRPRVAGFEAAGNTTYDIRVADVNADQRPDILLMYEADEGQKNGAVKVYLNEGVERGAVAAR